MGLMLLCWIVASINNVSKYEILGSLSIYLLVLLVGSSPNLLRKVPLIVSTVAVVSATVSIGIYGASCLGIYNQPLGRLGGVYGQPNILAALMLLGLFYYGHLLILLKKQSLVYLLPVLLLSMTLFMTGSRAALVAICLVLLLFILKWQSKELKGLQRFLIQFFLVVIAGYGVAKMTGDTTILERVSTSAFGEGGGIYKRLVYWLSGILMGSEHLIGGVGAGGYPAFLGDYAIRAAEILHLPYKYIGQTLWAHNDFIHIYAEYGAVVGLSFLVFVLMIFVNIWNNISRVSFFPFLALISFIVLMCFSHPLYRPGLTFISCLGILPLLNLYKGRRLCIAKKIYMPVLMLLLLMTNIYMAIHFSKTYNLYKFTKYWSQSTEPLLQRYQKGEQLYLVGNIDDSLYGWRFKHNLYSDLAQRAKSDDDRSLAQYIRPAMVRYSEQNRFSTFLFALSKVCYVMGDYEQARHYAQQAYDRNPENDAYFDFVHICNTLLISRQNNIAIDQLIPADQLLRLKEVSILLPRQFDSKGVTL